MAKILMTAIVADIRNKLNGSVFSKNRYGAYVRTKVTPVNPQTTSQQNARNILSTHSQGWRGLTDQQRQGWINQAPQFPFSDIFGNSKILSGNALYVKLNSNLNYANADAISDAPNPVEIPAITALAVTADSSTAVVTITFEPTPIPTGFAMLLQTTGNVPAGRAFVKNLFRNVAVRASGGASPWIVSGEFAGIHGAPVAGQKIFCRCFLISTVTGQAGIAIQAQTTVVE